MLMLMQHTSHNVPSCQKYTFLTVLGKSVELTRADRCSPNKLVLVTVIACAFWLFKIIKSHRLLYKSKAYTWFQWLIMTQVVLFQLICITTTHLFEYSAAKSKPLHLVWAPSLLEGISTNSVAEKLIYWATIPWKSFCHNTLALQTNDDDRLHMTITETVG